MFHSKVYWHKVAEVDTTHNREGYLQFREFMGCPVDRLNMIKLCTISHIENPKWDHYDEWEYKEVDMDTGKVILRRGGYSTYNACFVSMVGMYQCAPSSVGWCLARR